MNTPRVKVCGITRPEDGQLALSLGASYLGFILYSKSPRSIDLEAFTSLNASLTDSFRVVVDVRPDMDQVKRYVSAGFDFFQIHFSDVHEGEYLAELSELVGRDRLWLAPKLPPETLFPESLFDYTDNFLMDTFQKNGFGGSGKTGDWKGFRQLKNDYPEKTWILAGGLNPDNIEDAVNQSEADIVDVSSGLESSPGIKSADKLRAFFGNLSA
ncbi:phosphoribosylanthranilate isomerase [Opitutia bacterium ISCC 51]|nr:phosphoribosylanthranilate isomerase [Opitutae bacterium ISCC 51]QXD29398.1 phosphoribosylanthranilate isomerase [Opitutae bacterium ISCC 52]